MIKARILSTWENTSDGRRPALVNLLQPGDTLLDVTGQPSEVSDPVVCEVWGQATIDVARAHADYGEGAILMEWEDGDNG